MDPKTLANLDPKLRETYEKVMGTSTSPSTRTSNPATPPPPANIPPAKPAPAAIPPLPNIPPPASPLTTLNNPTLPATPINNATIVTTQSPLQTQDFAALQATPTGTPLLATQLLGGQLGGKPIQPLPSPASINKAIEQPSHSSPVIRALYIIASIIFFAVYTVFWLKILKFPNLPF